MTKTTSFSPMASTFAIVCGAVFWAALFAFVGAMTGHAWSGAACGTVIGAVIGYGFTKHLIGRAVVWVSVFGVLGAVIGPGCDADACSSAVGGAVIGGLLGWFGWLGIFMFLFGVVGLSVGGHYAGGVGSVVGMVFGAASAWFAAYCDRRIALQYGFGSGIAPSNGEPTPTTAQEGLDGTEGGD